MNVLIVDDKQSSARLAEELHAIDVKTQIAIDFPNAMMQYNQQRPDAIICEVPLPQSCGFELAAYIRNKEEVTPIVFYSHLLDTRALNLAVWLGADAYLTKPATAQRLIEAVQECIDSKSIQRRRSLDQNEFIFFRCMCGEEMKAKPAHLGKYIPCRNCGRNVQAPEHRNIIEGNWVTSDAKSGRNVEQPGFRCQACQRYLNPLHAKRNGDCDCASCHATTKLPTWVLRRQKLFNKYLEKENFESHHSKPQSSHIQLQCPVCKTYFQYDIDSKSHASCSFCQTQFSVHSLKNAPLSKVQLLASGRYGMIKKCPENAKLERKSFLLPHDSRVKVGTSKECQIRLSDSKALNIHCQLRCDSEDHIYCVPEPGAMVIVNGEMQRQKTLLKGKSDITLGNSTISIYASGKTSENKRIRRGIKQYFKFSESQFYGHNTLLIESACILYDYWSTN